MNINSINFLGFSKKAENSNKNNIKLKDIPNDSFEHVSFGKKKKDIPDKPLATDGSEGWVDGKYKIVGRGNKLVISNDDGYSLVLQKSDKSKYIGDDNKGTTYECKPTISDGGEKCFELTDINYGTKKLIKNDGFFKLDANSEYTWHKAKYNIKDATPGRGLIQITNKTVSNALGRTFTLKDIEDKEETTAYDNDNAKYDIKRELNRYNFIDVNYGNEVIIDENNGDVSFLSKAINVWINSEYKITENKDESVVINNKSDSNIQGRTFNLTKVNKDDSKYENDLDKEYIEYEAVDNEGTKYTAFKVKFDKNSEEKYDAFAFIRKDSRDIMLIANNGKSMYANADNIQGALPFISGYIGGYTTKPKTGNGGGVGTRIIAGGMVIPTIIASTIAPNEEAAKRIYDETGTIFRPAWIVEKEEKPADPPVDPPVNPPETDPVDPPETDPVNPPETDPVDPPETKPVDPPETKPVDPPETKPVDPPETKPVDPPETDPVNPPETDPVDPPETDPVNPPVDDDEPPVDEDKSKTKDDEGGKDIYTETEPISGEEQIPYVEPKEPDDIDNSGNTGPTLPNPDDRKTDDKYHIKQEEDDFGSGSVNPYTEESRETTTDETSAPSEISEMETVEIDDVLINQVVDRWFNFISINTDFADDSAYLETWLLQEFGYYDSGATNAKKAAAQTLANEAQTRIAKINEMNASSKSNKNPSDSGNKRILQEDDNF